MTQKLVTLNVGNRPLDFGREVAFNAELGMLVQRRADFANYACWYQGVTANDVTITDVSDNYTLPVPPLSVPPAPPLDHAEQRRAMVRARARDLDKKGKYLEASALRATIGE